MEKLIREILVLPLRLVLLINRFLSVVDQYTLIKWAWEIGRQIDDGYNYVVEVVDKNGLEAGRDLARQISEQTSSAKIIYLISWFELREENYEAAKSWIDLTEQMQYQDAHLLLSIKHSLSYKMEEYDRDAILEEMLACNYLAPEQTKEALMAKACQLMECEEYVEAEKIIDHMLSIAETTGERLFKGMICLIRNEDRDAIKHFYKSKGKIPDEHFYAAVSRAGFNIGRDQFGMDWLHKAVNAGFNVSEENKLLWEVYNSKEYADYCAMRK